MPCCPRSSLNLVLNITEVLVDTNKILLSHTARTFTLIVSMSAFVICAVALLFAFASDLQSQVLLSVMALGWFTLVWCHVSAVDNAFRSIRSAGTITSLTGLILSFIIVWYQPTRNVSSWVQLTLICYVLSYVCAHFAYFLKTHSILIHTGLQALQLTAIVSMTVSGILAMIFVVADGNIASTFFYRMLISFIALDVLSTVSYSMLKRRLEG